MSLIDVPGGLVLPPSIRRPGGPASISGLTIDNVGEKLSMHFQAPKSGEVSKIHFRTGGIGSAGNVGCNIKLETLTADVPDGTLQDVGAPSSVAFTFIGTGVGNHDNQSVEATLDGTATVTQGEWLAATWEITSQDAGGDTVAIMYMADNQDDWLYTGARDTGTGYAKNTNAFSPLVSLEYDDGSRPPILNSFPADNAGSTSRNSGDADRFVGAKFQLPHRARLWGCWLYAKITEDFNILVLGTDGDSGSPLATLSVNGGFTKNTAHEIAQMVLPAVTLERNTDYYLIVQPTTGNDVLTNFFTFVDEAQHNGMPLGTNWVFVQNKGANDPPTQASHWDVGTGGSDNLKRFLGGLIIDAVEVGGLLNHPGTSGGANG